MKDIQVIREDKYIETRVLQRSDTRLYRTSKDSSGTLASLPNSQLASTTTTTFWNMVKSGSLVVSVIEGGTPQFIQGVEVVLEAILGASLASTALACPHATARATGG